MTLVCLTNKQTINILNEKVQTFYLHINSREEETAVTLVITFWIQHSIVI